MKLFLIIVFTVFIVGCVSPYSATSHEQLTQLKAYHTKVLDYYTENSESEKMENNKVFDVNKLIETYENGDLKFREAREFSASLKDVKRNQNIDYLHEIFKEDMNFIKSKARFLTIYEVTPQKEETIRGYEQAIKNETIKK